MVRTRFAPSPTGYMHIGNLRTALYAYLTARHYGGVLVLRIEDTDRRRNVEDAVQVIYDSLRLAGLDYDEGPDKGGDVRPVRAEPASADLQGAGRATWSNWARPTGASAARSRLSRRARRSRKARMRSDETPARPPRPKGPAKVYDPCRFLTRGRGRPAGRAGESHVIRQRIPETRRHDVPRSRLRLDLVAQRPAGRPGAAEVRRLPDVQLRQRGRRPPDGHHARDARGRVSLLHAQVQPAVRQLRLADPRVHPPAAHRQGGRQEAVQAGGRRLVPGPGRAGLPAARRSSTTSRCSAGTRPTTASSSRLQGLVEAFDIDRINKSSAGFSIAKLDWLNGEHIRALSAERVPRARAAVLPARTGRHGHPDHQPAHPAAGRAPDRHPRDGGVLRPARGARQDALRQREVQVDAREQPPHPGERRSSCSTMRPRREWTHEALAPMLVEWGKANGFKTGTVMWPVRIALSGLASTPGGATEIAQVLGKAETLEAPAGGRFGTRWGADRCASSSQGFRPPRHHAGVVPDRVHGLRAQRRAAHPRQRSSAWTRSRWAGSRPRTRSAIAIFLVPFGRAADIYGRRRVFTAGLRRLRRDDRRWQRSRRRATCSSRSACCRASRRLRCSRPALRS